jgi:hypothetical protein
MIRSDNHDVDSKEHLELNNIAILKNDNKPENMLKMLKVMALVIANMPLIGDYSQ